MRAMATRDLDTVELTELPDPKPGPGEVLVRVVCSAINPADVTVVSGAFARRFLHAKTSPLVVGYDFSGTVEARGSGVDDLEVGARVFGHLPYSGSTRQGAFAELVTQPREQLARLPDEVEHPVAAAAATVGLTALQSIRDVAGVGKGKRVLVIGAAGGVGSSAIGVAKRLGAEVVAVCSTKDVERVEALGADEVIDRKHTDPLRGEARFDMVFDTPGAYSYGACAHLLRPGGTYLNTLPSPALLWGKLQALFSSRRCSMIVVASRRADLEQLGQWLTEGLTVPIDSRHPVRELKAALQRMRAGGRAGRVVIDVADGW
jgi:NADPH:quinone reductase